MVNPKIKKLQMDIFQNNSMDWWTGDLPDLGADALTPHPQEPVVSQPETQASATTTTHRLQSAVCHPGGVQGENTLGSVMHSIPPVPPHILSIIAELETVQNTVTAPVARPVMDNLPPLPTVDMSGTGPKSLSDPIAPVLHQPSAVKDDRQKRRKSISGRRKLTKAQTKKQLRAILAVGAMSPIQGKLINLAIEEY